MYFATGLMIEARLQQLFPGDLPISSNASSGFRIEAQTVSSATPSEYAKQPQLSFAQRNKCDYLCP
tara:strand:- start:3202 stop:3399 length:198 start_codon:yes stop_codon:yes gene_type:complete